VEGLGLALDEHGDLKLGVQALAVGTVAVGPAAGAFAFDEGTGEHFAEGAEAAYEASAGLEVGVAWHLYMTLIIVSEQGQVKDDLKNARMTKPRGDSGTRRESKPWDPWPLPA
jgi:hypothetical protein